MSLRLFLLTSNVAHPYFLLIINLNPENWGLMVKKIQREIKNRHNRCVNNPSVPLRANFVQLCIATPLQSSL